MKLVILSDKETIKEGHYKPDGTYQTLQNRKRFDEGVETVYAAAREITDEELDKIAEEWAKHIFTYDAVPHAELNEFSSYLKERMK